MSAHRTALKLRRDPEVAGQATHREQRPLRQGAAQWLEYNILLTATLCLLAFGAVMVYSASSASSPGWRAGGSGTGELVKFVLYGALGLFLMRVFARDGIAPRPGAWVAPLLAVLLRARARRAHPSRRRERQRRAPLDR